MSGEYKRWASEVPSFTLQGEINGVFNSSSVYQHLQRTIEYQRWGCSETFSNLCRLNPEHEMARMTVAEGEREFGEAVSRHRLAHLFGSVGLSLDLPEKNPDGVRYHDTPEQATHGLSKYFGTSVIEGFVPRLNDETLVALREYPDMAQAFFDGALESAEYISKRTIRRLRDQSAGICEEIGRDMCGSDPFGTAMMSYGIMLMGVDKDTEEITQIEAHMAQVREMFPQITGDIKKQWEGLPDFSNPACG